MNEKRQPKETTSRESKKDTITDMPEVKQVSQNWANSNLGC